MFNKLRNIFFRNRHNIAVFVLLNTGCAVCIALVAARVAYTDSSRHSGLIWNLFLAWIPFILAYIAHAISWRRIWVYLIIPVIAFLWLIFFPNAPYMLTDLQDLARVSPGAPLWYDVIIVVWCSWTAMLLGIVSLYLMQDIVLLVICIHYLSLEQFRHLYRPLCAAQLVGYSAGSGRGRHGYSRSDHRSQPQTSGIHAQLHVFLPVCLSSALFIQPYASRAKYSC